MPEIADKAGAALGKKVGPLPVGGWAAIGIGVVVVVKLLKGGGGGGGSDTVTVPDAFAGGDAGGGSGTTVPVSSPPAGTGSATPAPGGIKVRFTGDTHVYSLVGQLLSGLIHKSGTTYDATIFKIGAKSYYRIKYNGSWRLIPTTAKTVQRV